MFHCKQLVKVSARFPKSFSQLKVLKCQLSTEVDVLDLFQGKHSSDHYNKIVADPKPVAVAKKAVSNNAKNVIINSKRKELNHYRNQKYDKFKPIPLVSNGWHHSKSAGDYFTILMNDQDHSSRNIFWDVDSGDFESYNLDEVLIKAIKATGFEKPTKIQHDAIPGILSGRNTLIAAETGCGKTLAFLIPILQQIMLVKQQMPQREPNTPLALILTPSRELATQIGNVAKELCNHLPISCNVLTGGRMKQRMLNPEFRDIDLQISTLGAISKLTTTGIYNMNEVKHLVLDESDTMLDDSFSDHLLRYLRKFKLRYLPSQKSQYQYGCQLILASATYPNNFKKTLENFIEPDSILEVVSKNLHKVMPHVPQTFYRLKSTDKPAKLLHLAKSAIKNNEPTMIFSNKTPTCDWISMILVENGISAINLNGDMPLVIRQGKFEEFLQGNVNIISCTDIASRGLDTKHIKHVINYDFPMYMADYIHRCGRTGRCGSPADCHVSNFVSGIREVELVKKIEMSVRAMESLPNVNGNITSIIKKQIGEDS